MSIHQKHNRDTSDDEIDLGILWSKIKDFFRALVRGILAIIQFYIQKATLFSLLLVVGIGIGLLIHLFIPRAHSYMHQITIVPKYESTEYLYKSIENLNENLRNDDYHTLYGLTKEQFGLIKEVEIKPIIRVSDILDNLNSNYEGKEPPSAILVDLEEIEFEKEKFYDFYKQHQLTIYYTSEPENAEISEALTAFISKNPYFEKHRNVKITEYKRNLEANQNSLQFINSYLDKISQSEKNQDTNVVLYSNDEDIPTVATLLKQKELLLEQIGEQEEALAMDQDVLSIVRSNPILQQKSKLLYRYYILIPLLLFGAVSLYYLSKYISSAAKQFAYR